MKRDSFQALIPDRTTLIKPPLALPILYNKRVFAFRPLQMPIKCLEPLAADWPVQVEQQHHFHLFFLYFIKELYFV